MSLKSTGLERVVEKQLCTLCGACTAACPRGMLLPTSSDSGFIARCAYNYLRDAYCLFCGVCYDVCPIPDFNISEVETTFLGRERKQEEEDLGVYRGYYVVRSTNKDLLEKAQDGGGVTALLAYALYSEQSDCAVATGIRGDDSWRPEPIIAQSVYELFGTAGSKYTPCPTIMGLVPAVDKYGKKRVAIAGLPCHVWAIRKMQLLPERRPLMADSIQLVIGIFCHSLFHHTRFMDFVRKQGVEPREILKFIIRKGKFSVLLKGGHSALNMSAIELAKKANLDLEICLHCTDYLAEFADISVGGFGSPEGWSTILTRSERGDRLLNQAWKSGFIECVRKESLSPGIVKLAGLKRRKAQKPYIPGKYGTVFG